MRLNGQELLQFNHAVGAVHATREAHSFSANLLRALRAILPADIAVADWRDCPLHSISTAYDPGGAISREVNEAVHRHLKDNPLYGRRHREACSISDLLSRSQWHSTGLYMEAYGKASQEDGLAIDFDFPDRCRLSLCATRDRRGFSRSERLMMTLLVPHVTSAYALMRENTPGAWLTVSPDGTVSHWHEEARWMLARYFGISSVSNHRLPAGLTAWLKQTLAAISQPGSAGPTPLKIIGSSCTLTLRLVFSETNREELFLQLSETRNLHLPLSPRETEVHQWLREGKTNSEIATLLGISPGTVKRHLENLYAKLGVENRHAASRWAP